MNDRCSLHIFYFNHPAPTEIYTLSLHDALPISRCRHPDRGALVRLAGAARRRVPVLRRAGQGPGDGELSGAGLCRSGGVTARAQHNDTASDNTEGPALCRARRVGDTTRGLLDVVAATLTYEFPRPTVGPESATAQHRDGYVTQIRQSAGTASRVGFCGSRSPAFRSISLVMCIEQNFGPHMAQNSALLKYSAGSASSWSSRARSGSSDSRNCSYQSNA